MNRRFQFLPPMCFFFFILFASLTALAGTKPKLTLDEYSPVDFHDEIPESIYEQARTVLLEIHRRFPSQKYFHVYLGRSGTLLSRFDQNLSSNIASNLPFSGAHLPNQWNRSRKLDEADFYPLTKNQTQNVYEHFLRFLPSFEVLAGRKIVLIDYVSTGEGMLSALSYLAKFNEQLGFPFEFSALAMTNDTEKELKRKSYGFDSVRAKLQQEISGDSKIPVQVYSLESAPDFGFAMMGNKFDKVAEFGRFNPSLDKGKNLVRRISYDLLAYRLFQRMIQDEQLRKNISPKLWSEFKGKEKELRALELATHDLGLVDESLRNALLLYKDFVGKPEAFHFFIKTMKSKGAAVYASEFYRVIVPSLSSEEQFKALDWGLKNGYEYELASSFPFGDHNLKLLEWFFNKLDPDFHYVVIESIFPNLKDSDVKARLFLRALSTANKSISTATDKGQLEKYRSTKAKLEMAIRSSGLGLLCTDVLL